MLFVYIVLHVAICALIGWLGRDRKFGRWGYFFASLLLTPFVGLLLVAASDPLVPHPLPPDPPPVVEPR